MIGFLRLNEKSPVINDNAVPRWPVNRLNAGLGFDHWYEVSGGMIPSNHRRWCTKMLKLKPFEEFVGDDPRATSFAIAAAAATLHSQRGVLRCAAQGTRIRHYK